MSLLVNKIIFLVCIFAGTMLSACLPWILRSAIKIKHFLVVMTVGMALSAGIILGGALTHLLPEGSEAFEEYFTDTADPGIEHTDYPFSTLIAGATLITLVVIDQVINASVSIHPDHGGHGHNHMVVEVPTHDPRRHARSNAEAERGSASSPDSSSSSDSTSSKGRASADGSEDEEEEVVTDEERRKRIAQAWIFFIALSVHSVFDGLGVGAEASDNGFYGLLVAVSSHKLLDGFALGVPVYFAKLPRWQTFGSLIFCSLMTPLGVGIGIGATEQAGAAQGLLARGIILSISAGSFLFISLVELLPAALHKHGYVKAKLVLFALGWGIMALIGIWV